MAKDFAAKEGWLLGLFFDEPDGYTFRVHFLHGRVWNKRGPDTFASADDPSGNTYIAWKQEKRKWVIQKISNNGP
jgi:hypothetical protein